jgi:hypothetical protein
VRQRREIRDSTSKCCRFSPPLVDSNPQGNWDCRRVLSSVSNRARLLCLCTKGKLFIVVLSYFFDWDCRRVFSSVFFYFRKIIFLKRVSAVFPQDFRRNLYKSLSIPVYHYQIRSVVGREVA